MPTNHSIDNLVPTSWSSFQNEVFPTTRIPPSLDVMKCLNLVQALCFWMLVFSLAFLTLSLYLLIWEIIPDNDLLEQVSWTFVLVGLASLILMIGTYVRYGRGRE